MANEIHVDYDSGNTVYAVIRNSAGQVWNPVAEAFEDWGTSGHDAEDYALPLADKGGSRYIGDFDVNIPAGHYTIQAFLQAGAEPIDGDSLISRSDIIWRDNGVLTIDKILINKAVQSKSTGTIDYYDDDGQTVLLTLIPSEDESSITRIPS
jgi:hypothetical protein